MTVLPDGRVVAAAATRPAQQALATADLFDRRPAAGRHGFADHGAPIPGRHLAGDGSVMVIGGHGASADYLASCEIFTPPPARVTYPATTFHPLDPRESSTLASGTA